jgi:hypothetical protein
MLESKKHTAQIDIQKSLLIKIDSRVLKPQKIALPKLQLQKKL